jgi:ATP-dependent Clp protease ATP-binding subunit ClpA
VGTQLFSRARVGYGEDGGRTAADEIMKEVRAQFTPEFLNRVDEVVIFKGLTPESLGRIVDLQLADLRDRLRHQGKTIVLEPGARHILAELGYSFEYGARNLGRTLRREVSEPMAQLALTPDWEKARSVRVFAKDGRIELELIAGEGVATELPLSEMESHEEE